MFDQIKRLFSKPQTPEFHDSKLGLLTFDCGVWIGLAQRDERVLRFAVAGTNTMPDAALLNRVCSLLSGFSKTEQMAIEFLRSQEPELHQAILNFYSFEFIWVNRPDDFTFEFLANGDDSQVWRVEFIAGTPSKTGFDD